MVQGRVIPVDQALDIANSFLGLMRERAVRVTDAATGERVAEFSWPNYRDELREAEPHAHIVVNWLKLTGHLITVRRQRPDPRTGASTPALYRVSLGRRFTENDLKLARLAHARSQAAKDANRVRKTRDAPVDPAPAPAPTPGPSSSTSTPSRPRVRLVAPPDLRPGVHATKITRDGDIVLVEVLSAAQQVGEARTSVNRTIEAARRYAALAPGGELDATALLGAAGDIVNDLRKRVLELEKARDAGTASTDALIEAKVTEVLRRKFGGK